MKFKNFIDTPWPTALFVFIYFIVTFLFMPISYHCYDDKAIEMDLAGGYINPFLSVPLSGFLSFLYGVIALPWYPVFLYAIHGIALFLLIAALRKFVFPRPLVYFIILFLVFLSSFFHVILTFTTAGFMIGIAGLTAFFIHLYSYRISLLSTLGYGACFATAYLVRPDVLTGILTFTAFFFAWIILFDKHKRLKALLFLAPVLILYFINTGLSESLHEESSYLQFNRVRGLFHEYPIIWHNADNPAILEANDWKENDYWLLADGFTMHEEKYNIQSLRNIFKYSVPLPEEDNILRTLFTFNRISGFKSTYRIFLYSIYALLIFTLFYVPPRSWWIIIGYNAFALYSFLWGYHYFRLPFRGGAPLFFLVICLTIFLIGILHRPTKIFTRFRKQIIPGLCLLLTILMSMAIYRLERDQLSWIREGRTCWNHIRKELNMTMEQGIILAPIPYQFVHPFKEDKKNFTILDSGWTTYSDRYYDSISDLLDVEKASEVLPALMEHPEGYLLSGDIFAERLVQFIEETYGIPCRAEKIKSFPCYTFRPEEVALTGLYRIIRIDQQ